ncbi:OLC1v1027185C1 [Oldenlandia corymbosa var. corymbosa]|uniref:OLC1v1027185C1 n=1 Tax=Oldenlandia corymbosa var. corymbosa TaxID=529605 RepID=A0AAV1CC43_OLDCO|nr:OLC1v1027185C1 [Oldenlandia corymbosa var. corymbosa]
MGVVIIDGSTVRDFVSNEAEFNKSTDEKFADLDLNHDGVLSRSELRKAFESFRLIETHFGVDVATPPEELTKLYDSIFEKFDGDHNGTVDLEEFRSEMKKIMLAIADGLGSCPIQMVLDDDSFLKQAADLEASKIPGRGVVSRWFARLVVCPFPHASTPPPVCRSIFPIRPATYSVSSRRFNTNAARDCDEDDGHYSLDADRRTRCAPPFAHIPIAFPDMDAAFNPFGIRTWRPFLNMDFPMGTGHRRPYAAKETPDGLQLRWDMPGMGKEDVKVHVEENTLVIKGEARKDSEDDEIERSFSTRIDLPDKLFKTNAIKAEMKNGVLKVLLPKVKEEERKDVFNIKVD